MSSQLSGVGYGNNSYGKASLSYLALKDMLGDELFKKALHNYMEDWNGKHPIPWDYFYRHEYPAYLSRIWRSLARESCVEMVSVDQYSKLL